MAQHTTYSHPSAAKGDISYCLVGQTQSDFRIANYSRIRRIPATVAEPHNKMDPCNLGTCKDKNIK